MEIDAVAEPYNDALYASLRGTDSLFSNHEFYK